MTLHEIVIKRVKWTTKDLCCGLTPQNDVMYSAKGTVTLKLKIDEVIPQVACSRFKECYVGQEGNKH